jgi:hypothetical protein
MLLVIFVFLGCAADEPLGPSERRITGRVQDLLQIVTVSPRRSHRGDRLEITSSIVNEGTSARTIHVLDCVLDVRTELSLLDDVARCGGYDTYMTVAPGDSVRYFGPPAGGIVRSGRGRYDVEVRHLLEPELRIAFTVDVVEGR